MDRRTGRYYFTYGLLVGALSITCIGVFNYRPFQNKKKIELVQKRLLAELDASNEPVLATVVLEQPATQEGGAYWIFAQGDDGVKYTVGIVDGPEVSRQALDDRIHVGSRISFPHGNWLKGDLTSFLEGSQKSPEETDFHKTQMGYKLADRVRVLH